MIRNNLDELINLIQSSDLFGPDFGDASSVKKNYLKDIKMRRSHLELNWTQYFGLF